jgi:phosphoglycolate phosphatase
VSGNKWTTTPASPILVFDLDGTILDTFLRQYVAYKESVAAVGSDTRFGFRTFSRLRRNRMTILALAESEAPRHASPLYAAWKKRIESRKLLGLDTTIPGIVQLLDDLRGRFVLVLCTIRENRNALKWQLDRLNLSHRFDRILVASPQYKASKHDLILQVIGNASALAAVIGDTEVDVQTANQLSVPSICVSYGQRTKSFLRTLKPRVIVDDISSLRRELEKLPIEDA